MVNSSIWCFKCVDGIYSDCGCNNQPVITQIDKCPALAMIYIDTHLAADLSNACAVLNYVKQNYKCVPSPLEPEEEPVTPIDEDDDWVDGGGNDDEPDEDYNEYLRKPIWWYHTDHLGSSTYLTDNFGRPSHYYETLPFGEMIVEHNQSKYYKIPYPTTNTGTYDNKWKFNGKELDDATGMYYYGARYYDPRVSIWVSVDQKAEKTMTPYQYVNNNPIMFTDPTGMEAIIVFNAKTAQLMITDMDHYKKGLKTKYVTAQEYKIGGIRDSNGNLTHNQTLVINGVFSGGKGTSDGILQGDQNGVENVSYGPKMIPIPNGEYDVLNNDDGYYRLDAVDSYRYDCTSSK